VCTLALVRIDFWGTQRQCVTPAAVDIAAPRKMGGVHGVGPPENSTPPPRVVDIQGCCAVAFVRGFMDGFSDRGKWLFMKW